MKINPHLNTPLWGSLSLLILFSSLSFQAFSLPPLSNPRLKNAYYALQAWKHAITSDPNGFTSNWCGPNVCDYNGVYCAPAPDDPQVITVAGIDLNHAGISGELPEELGLLTDLALFHINSNFFSGTLPESFSKLRLLHELDVSNNLFSGTFPYVVLNIPSLKFLDIRFNKFEGELPSRLFDLRLDALFVNNNNFDSTLPKNLGNSPVSVVVLGNNIQVNGCLPLSIGNMGGTLTEIVLVNMGLKGCLPTEIGLLKEATVFDVSDSMFEGTLPESMGGMSSLEQLNVANNKLSGDIPASICALPKLENFTYSYNYFRGEPAVCLNLPAKDDRKNCIPGRPEQRSPAECNAAYSRPVECGAFGFGCSPISPPPPSPPPPSPPPPCQTPHLPLPPPYHYL
ncbi:hypothetical protein RHMOL_Rhmol04G0326000 [Rhododendron molle]|uniref:Uncharacterized protein n=1 Tax=Rhododendron molle TaxID=49168 RepID=A0ACC0P7Y6_RHOML|nr:hypothetical protein RHMOL_Rhmol04G0326000 [Rhododendron molle]